MEPHPHFSRRDAKERRIFPQRAGSGKDQGATADDANGLAQKSFEVKGDSTGTLIKPNVTTITCDLTEFSSLCQGVRHHVISRLLSDFAPSRVVD